jgi:amino acid adenylation domain-containing protein
MLEDAKPLLVIHQDVDALTLPASDRWRRLSVDALFAAAESQSAAAVARMISATHPAYIMFTSGSTGQPKGVIVPHRGIVRLVRDQSYVEFNEQQTFLQISALAFDACTWEVWGALLNGGRIAVIRGERVSIPQLREAISRHGVTAMFFTAALFNAIVDSDVGALKGLQQIVVGGDVLSPEHVARAMAELPDASFINGYGPTEATTFSVCYRMPRAGAAQSAIPIGRPLNHTSAYILDENSKPVAVGEIGQLWIGGDGVAIGYLNRPELSTDRFRPDPFSALTDARMYATGDFARLSSEGLIEFFGRRDRQVKVDGKRIELDEVELALRSSPTVADSVVSVRVISPADRQIVAFVKPAASLKSVDAASLIAQDLRARLPRHMVPARIIAVDEFPLTANGKIDRSALMQLLGSKCHG